MPPRPSLSALRRYATAAASSSSSASSAAAPHVAEGVTAADAAALASVFSPSAAANAPRVYTERKAFLYDYYSHLLRRSELVLVFRHENLTVADSGAIRAAIAALPVPRPASLPADAPAPEGATVTVARTGILAPVVRAVRPQATQFAEELQGPTALVTCPSLSPRYIKGMLAAIDKAVKGAKKDVDPKKKPEDIKQPAFTLLAGVLEGTTFVDAAAVRDAAKLPELDQLRGQLVGLLESPQRQLIGIAQQAGGGSLVRTLQGLEASLKEKEAPSS